jgi:hypothetical protein
MCSVDEKSLDVAGFLFLSSVLLVQLAKLHQKTDNQPYLHVAGANVVSVITFHFKRRKCSGAAALLRFPKVIVGSLCISPAHGAHRR